MTHSLRRSTSLTRQSASRSPVGVFTSAALLLLVVTDGAFAKVKLASVFGNGMVIQRDRPIPVWGTAAANSAVTITLGDQSATVTADAQGKWTTSLPARPAGGPFSLTVSDPDGAVNVSDVLIGDVWLCSGQSNMQMSLGEADNGKATAARAATHRTLRLCKIGRAWTDTPQTHAQAEWKPSTPESAEAFSAVGYFFGHALLQSPRMQAVPLGLIESDMGGTLAEAWAPKEELAGIDKSKIGNSMFGIGPTTLYNGMIAPLGPVGLKGVLWYQGEGNANGPESYPPKLSAVIRGWRGQFNNASLPFVIVQLPDFSPGSIGYSWQWLRDAQQQVAATVPNVGLVTALNTNDGLDLHPKPKEAIGTRAALLVRQTVYHENIVGHGPVFESAEPRGDALRVNFKPNRSALAATDANDVHGFLIAGDDGKYRNATARIDGDHSVIVRSDLVPQPRTVRYAWSGVPNATLTNKEGLPAYPFRTDTRPLETFGQQPQPGALVVGSKDYRITITDGRITDFVVYDKQLLSNETGQNAGVNMPSFFGPRGFGPYAELGPDLHRLGDAAFSLTIGLEPAGCTWTVKNDRKDGETIRLNVSPRVNVSPLQDGRVTLTRPGLKVIVSGVNRVNTDDGLTALEFRSEPHTTTTIRFDFNAE